MANKNLKSGEDFADLAIKLLDDTYELCEETYAATQEVPPKAEMKRLISQAEIHIAKYNELLAQYTGGRKESIQEAGPHVGRLVEFTDVLKKLVEKHN